MNNEMILIDNVLEMAVTGRELALLERWKNEYKNRIRETLRPQRMNPPRQNSGNPGFEKGLVVRLCQLLAASEPYCEWPYASFVEESQNHVDIHLVYRNAGSIREIWIEVGMYASDEENKYKSDFDKLLLLIDNAPEALGVLIHFEIFERGQVLPLFQRFVNDNGTRYDINVRVIGDRTNIQICRLFIASMRGRRNEQRS